MRAKANQHDSDRSLQRTRQRFRYRMTEQNGSTRKGEQRQRVAQAQVGPCLTMSFTSLRRAAIEDTAAI
jgi:hypothetical protein